MIYKINIPNFLKLKIMYNKLERLPVFCGTALFIFAIMILSRKMGLLVWLNYLNCFIIGCIFTFKACIMLIHDKCFIEESDEPSNKQVTI